MSKLYVLTVSLFHVIFVNDFISFLQTLCIFLNYLLALSIITKSYNLHPLFTLANINRHLYFQPN